MTVEEADLLDHVKADIDKKSSCSCFSSPDVKADLIQLSGCWTFEEKNKQCLMRLFPDGSTSFEFDNQVENGWAFARKNQFFTAELPWLGRVFVKLSTDPTCVAQGSFPGAPVKFFRSTSQRPAGNWTFTTPQDFGTLPASVEITFEEKEGCTVRLRNGTEKKVPLTFKGQSAVSASSDVFLNLVFSLDFKLASAQLDEGLYLVGERLFE